MHEATTLHAINPRTGKVDYSVEATSPTEIAALSERLRAGQRAWSAAPLAERIAVLLRWADAVAAHSQAITDAESIDTGRYRLSKEAPMMVVGAIRGWCASAPKIVESARLAGASSVVPGVTFDTDLSPYPLLGVVSPWNQPFLLSMIDAVPALLAGCAVIVKPSEITPRFIEPLMHSVRDVPELAAVLAVVPGGPETGRAILEACDVFSFTGSVPTGRKIAEACAKRFIPAFLELGGKDAAIVTANANLEHAAAAVLRGSVLATGQVCFATERVYVQADVHDAFVDILKRKASALELNYPDIHQGHIGPFTMQRQAAIADTHLKDALDKGAKLILGGPAENLGGGLYMRPTILTEVTHDMSVMRDETFAPITPVMRYQTTDDAVRLANEGEYGLSAAVIAGSVDEARAIAIRLDAGAISLQDTGLTLAIMRDAEKNSFNCSGMGGSRMGPNAIKRFLRPKALIAASAPPVEMEALRELPA